MLIRKGRSFVSAFVMIVLITGLFSQTGQASAAEDNRSWVEYTEKIMAKDTDNGTLELELQGNIKLAKNYDVTLKGKKRVYQKSLADVRVGAENVTVRVNHKDEITKIFIDGPTPIETMRVGIMTSGFATVDHDTIVLSSQAGLEIVDKVAEETFVVPANEKVTFTPSNNEITVTSATGEVLYTTTNRLYAFTDEGNKIKVENITRASGDPSYRGFFEITTSSTGNKLNLINEVDFEQYLYQVVPSEMPAYFGVNALKAQAVAARTYALGDYLSDRFAKDGFFVLDSVMSQVYNNTPENAATTQAVNETAGVIMLGEDGSLVDARYYSTSGGYGASKHQVWAEADGTFPSKVLPYLIAQSHTFDPNDPSKMLEIDTQSEEEILEFYKTLSHTGYDGNSPWFRWKVSLSKEELENTINANIISRQAADPKFVLTQNEVGDFVSQPIPAEGIGEFVNMYVAKRGDGGNIMELVIEGTTGTYKIIKEYNIRFTIRPTNAFTKGETVVLHRATAGSSGYTGTLDNYTILPSAFFGFELDEENTVTFYGGGNGHGVGMSQYGAYYLGTTLGYEFDRILTSYYPNMSLESTSILSKE
ncbi:SpoIID/LytB domain-containing protein [Fredinandcohnia sp. QZ13]|uniref:SpoIID/LytB domain-containing protein n=1 Tax=Fredinandcohnia sp. QZ13 TaxID=3073144 RepID=UPI0028534C3D|nr:SpoIID/LytB domain-containing protein [Fredinandcohnia sp. QZ13]MDR4890340.1 SpoIID/LytB domain-containing protein [Fredinandcohnia sp. QZ13]